MESERGMARQDRAHQDDIANMLCNMYRDQKPDLGSARRLINVYWETIKQLVSTGSITWNKRYGTNDFKLEKATYSKRGETLVGLIHIANALLSRSLIRLMLDRNQDLGTFDWENVIYLRRTGLNEQQIETLSQSLRSHTYFHHHGRIDYMHQLYNRKNDRFSATAIHEMLAYFQFVLTEIESIPAKKVKFPMLCSMLTIFNDLAKNNALIQEDQKHESHVRPEPLVHFVLKYIDKFEDAKEVSGKIMALPDITHLLKSPQFDWGFNSPDGESKNLLYKILFLLLQWCSNNSCQQEVLNKLCDYMSFLACGRLMVNKTLDKVYFYNQTYFKNWLKQFIEVLIEKRLSVTLWVSQCFLSPSGQPYFSELIAVLNELTVNQKSVIWEALIQNNAITANNIMLFYQGMTRKESCDFARLLIQYQKPLCFAEHTDSKHPYSFKLGSSTMPSKPLALTQEALSCTFKGGDAKREGERLNMLGWLLYYDLLPFQALRQCAVHYPLGCHSVVHDSFKGAFPSFNHYLILKDTSSLPEEVVNICMLYLAHPDLYNTIETLSTHASIMDHNEVLVDESSDDPLPPPLPEHALRDRKTPG